MRGMDWRSSVATVDSAFGLGRYLNHQMAAAAPNNTKTRVVTARAAVVLLFLRCKALGM